MWPFSDYRVAWNIISIIDPIFTLSLLFFIILSLTRKKILYARIGFVISCAYLILGFYKYEKVKAYTYNIAKNREHIVQRILLNPTIGNNILWRSVYQFKDHYYVDAIYFPFFSEPKIIKIGFFKLTSVIFLLSFSEHDITTNPLFFKYEIQFTRLSSRQIGTL